MDFSEGFLPDEGISADALVGEEYGNADGFVQYTMDDLSVSSYAGLGFLCVGAGMFVSYGIAWIVSLLRRA